MPLVALIAAFVVGPVGVGLGSWWLLKGPDGPKRRLAWAAVAVGLVQTVVLAALLTGGPGRDAARRTPESTSTPWSYPTTPPPNAPVPDGTATPTPVAPTATTLEEFVPSEVDSYEWQPSGTDAGAAQAGADGSQTGTFTSRGEGIGAAMAEWDSPEAASAYAQAQGQAAHPGAEPIADGDIRSGAGHWWYYEADGKASLYWYHGRFSASFAGDPMEVQDLFLRFPK